MSNLARDIGTEDMKIEELVKLLREDKLLVPTFQRDFVWDPGSILKLWDSMFRFYPIGSILYWETDSYLHTHRRLGGFTFPHDEDTVRKFKEWKYILDGQQRATSLLVCMLGGKGRIEGQEQFDYTLHFDATCAEFFFAHELPKRETQVPDKRLLVRVRDVPSWGFGFYKEISGVPGFSPEVEHNLQQLQRMFSDYQLSLIHVRGVEVGEVCTIFERINQEGKRLHPVDIIVARTYRSPDEETGYPGFYLRDNLRSLTNALAETGTKWRDIDELMVIQMVAMCLRKKWKEARNPYGITPAALDNLTTTALEKNWEGCQKTILDTVKFLTDQTIHGPGMLPSGYLVLPLCAYLHENSKPNRDLARQWFWRMAFSADDFRNSSVVYQHASGFFRDLEAGVPVEIEPLVLSRSALIRERYYYRNTQSRATLAWLAHQKPLDFSDPHAEVLDHVYLLMSHAPNLHHVCPLNFLAKVQGLLPETPADSLMNICFLRARTNIQISDRNPLDYIQEFHTVPDFDKILASHLIDAAFIERDGFGPYDYRDFLLARADAFCESVKAALPDVKVTIVD